MAERSPAELLITERHVDLVNEVLVGGHYKEKTARTLHGPNWLTWFEPEAAINPDTILEDAQKSASLLDRVTQALNRIPGHERLIIISHFGLEDGQFRTFEEVGLEVGGARGKEVTGKRIRQIEAMAKRRLRHPSRSGHLKVFLPQPPIIP